MHLEVHGRGEPVRMIVGGIHGREGLITEPILREIPTANITGTLIICNITDDSPYISTLDAQYYQSAIGAELIGLIRKYHPSIYIELHSYKDENLPALTDMTRKKKAGVPPLTELEHGVLMGSVSPLIRTSEFSLADFCFILEIPKSQPSSAIEVVHWIIRQVADAASRTEIMDNMKKRYPKQVQRAKKLYEEYINDVVAGGA